MGSKKKKRAPKPEAAPEPIAPAPFAAAPVSLARPKRRQTFGIATSAQGVLGAPASTTGLKTLLGQ